MITADRTKVNRCLIFILWLSSAIAALITEHQHDLCCPDIYAPCHTRNKDTAIIWRICLCLPGKSQGSAAPLTKKATQDAQYLHQKRIEVRPILNGIEVVS